MVKLALSMILSEKLCILIMDNDNWKKSDYYIYPHFRVFQYQM